ncbi:MAG TPA: transcriptional repressor LexA [Candidatus Binatia bacterium]|nr:transcriptional repressor LexA [Candidatus Binatia bacterium]
MILTRRQKEVWDYLEDYIAAHGYAPTLEEIGAHFGLSSLATVHKHLSNLESKGLIARKWNLSRAIEITPPQKTAQAVELPLLGRVAAGVPIEAIETEGTLTIPEDFVRRPHNAFALRVQGESMIGEGILDGDFVVVEKRPAADNGETVVAVLNGEATVKKFYHERGGKVRLQPANPQLQPIVAREKDVEIRGVVVAVLRKYGK